jgi:small conductance mechanosensitive channel
MEQLNTDQLSVYLDKFYELAIAYTPKLILAVITLIVGLRLIKLVSKGMEKLMDKNGMDVSLRPFLKGMLSILLKAVLVISVLGMIGIEMTSFIAILGAASLAIGMALSGTLQNFAGGVMILVFKPFKVGDYIEAQGYSGSVKEIQIFNTILATPDNRRIIIPNGGLSTGSMVNYSAEEKRRVDFVFGIGYDDDIDKAKEVIRSVAQSHAKVMKDPEPFIAVKELADSSVNFVVRLWVNAADYWDVHFYMNEMVKKEFDKQNISIPYPQTDIHIQKVD